MIVQMFLIIWTAYSLDSSGESDVYDNDDYSESIDTAPEFV